MVEQRPVVELEVRRPDHRNRVGSRLRSVRRERDGIARRLGAAVRGDLEPSRRRGDVELDNTTALDGREQDPFAGRAEGENPVQVAGDEKVDVRRERPLVQPVAYQGRDGGGKCSLQHSATLSCVA